MKVSDLMTRGVRTCNVGDTLDRAAQIMWENDCGCVPVVDDESRVVGMITDRDVCMAGYTQGKVYSEIPVYSAMARQVFAVGESDQLETAEMLMRDKQIRRLPVLDGGGKVQGMLSLNDIARHVRTHGRGSDGLRSDAIVQTLASIGAPHHAMMQAEKSKPRRSKQPG